MLKKITFLVVAAHALLVFVLLFSPAKPIKHPTKHIAVRTPVAAKHVAVAPSAAPPAKKISPQKKTASPAKSASTTPKQTPKQSKKPGVVAKDPEKKPRQIPKKLLEEIEEFTSQIEEKKGKVYSKPQLEIPQAIVSRQDLGMVYRQIESYQDTLVSYLHQSLNLPEYGEVKIALTLRDDGSVAKVVVLKAESVKNKEYLEKNLPLLKFPRPEGKEHVFVLTFINEI